MLSLLYSHEYTLRLNPLEKPMERAREAASRAVNLDQACQAGWEELAACYFFGRDFSAFHPAAERAISLNPRNGNTCAYVAMLIAYSGNWEHGVSLIERLMDLNRHHPGWYYFPMVSDHFRKGEYEAALEAAKKINMPQFHWTPIHASAGKRRVAQPSSCCANTTQYSSTSTMSARILRNGSRMKSFAIDICRDCRRPG